MKIQYLLFTALLLCIGACSSAIEVEPGSLDSQEVNDPSLTDKHYLLSTRPGHPLRPALIAVHGFTASTYEWDEFYQHAETLTGIQVSRVLLGGHGRDLEDFKEADWIAWGQPILDEYNALKKQGYKYIHIAGSSTGGTLILEQIASGAYDVNPPRTFIFIDALVIPRDKDLSIAHLVDPFISNVTQDLTPEERGHWYQNRPTEALKELNKLTKRVKGELARGIALPTRSVALVYQSKGDPTVDPISALLIKRGLTGRDDPSVNTVYTTPGLLKRGQVSLRLIESRLHVFTRLKGRDPETLAPTDRENQQRTFWEMVEELNFVG